MNFSSHIQWVCIFFLFFFCPLHFFNSLFFHFLCNFYFIFPSFMFLLHFFNKKFPLFCSVMGCVFFFFKDVFVFVFFPPLFSPLFQFLDISYFCYFFPLFLFFV
jgi:hypothetical protein